MNAAVFLDRDGVLIEDVGLLTEPGQIRILPRVAEALKKLKKAGFQLIVVSNQTVVARGLASEERVRELNRHLEGLLEDAGAPPLDAWYFCPHHPNATLPAYRIVCDCRKPGIGMFRRAAMERNLTFGGSFTVGDRISDIIAGKIAGCRAILVQTGRHLEPPIETAEPMDTEVAPDYICADLSAATDWILQKR